MTKEIDNRQNSTEVVIFKPTAGMIEYLDAAVRLLTDSPAKVSAECGLDRTNWYKWLKVEGFEDWFYEQYTKKRRRIIPKLDQITLKYAEKGNYNHLELMTKKVGDYPQEGPTHAMQINIVPILGEDKAE